MINPYAQVARAKWWLLSVEGASALGFACLHNHLWYPRWPADLQHVTPGPKEQPGIGHIGADPLGVEEQAKAMAESLLTVLGQRTRL